MTYGMTVGLKKLVSLGYPKVTAHDPTFTGLILMQYQPVMDVPKSRYSITKYDKKIRSKTL